MQVGWFNLNQKTYYTKNADRAVSHYEILSIFIISMQGNSLNLVKTSPCGHALVNAATHHFVTYPSCFLTSVMQLDVTMKHSAKLLQRNLPISTQNWHTSQNTGQLHLFRCKICLQVIFYLDIHFSPFLINKLLLLFS